MGGIIELLDVLRHGLPAATGAPRRHVVIVGAGIAGLTAGLLLKEAGHRVTILEARNRLGGRIYTYRGFAGGMYGEIGAMRFPRQHPLGQHLIHERFGLATTPFGMEDPDAFIHLHGRTVRRSAFAADSLAVDLPPHERGRLPGEILRAAMQPLLDLVDRPGGWEEIVDRYDRYSLLGWLLERGVSEQALWILGPLFNL
jgi:monoamine oxidase